MNNQNKEWIRDARTLALSESRIDLEKKYLSIIFGAKTIKKVQPENKKEFGANKQRRQDSMTNFIIALHACFAKCAAQ